MYYLIGFILMILFTLYYFNYNPWKEEPIDTSHIENSINELKSLNEYIDNGTSNRVTLQQDE